jgi:hypothetical protein
MDPKSDQHAAQKAVTAARRRRDLGHIERLKEGGAPKHLEGKTRLNAALLIRKRYEELLKPHGPHSMTEIQEHLGNAAGAGEVKIHRWMLRKGETEVTQSLIIHYAERAEPQKKTGGYLRIVGALAELAGDDPEEAMIAFLHQTGLSDRLDLKGGLAAYDPRDPRLSLADLLRDFAASVAEQNDLASLFDTAERLQLAWNPADGPIAVLLDAWHERMTRRGALDGLWLVNALPPFPSVPLARIPFAHVEEAGFDLGGRAPDRQKGAATEHRRGSATAYWRLHLSIAPAPGGGVMPCFLRTTGLTVRLAFPDGSPEPRQSFDIADHEDDLFELVPGGRDRAWIDLDGPKWIAFDAVTAARVENPQAQAALYRTRKRLRRTDDEMPPHEGLPFARLTHVSPASIEDWLLDMPDPVLAAVELEPALAAASEWCDPGMETWMRGPSLARDLEIALRTGVLRDALSEWVESYRQSLTELEEAYLARMGDADRELRTKWRSATAPVHPDLID